MTEPGLVDDIHANMIPQEATRAATSLEEYRREQLISGIHANLVFPEGYAICYIVKSVPTRAKSQWHTRILVLKEATRAAASLKVYRPQQLVNDIHAKLVLQGATRKKSASKEEERNAKKQVQSSFSCTYVHQLFSKLWNWSADTLNSVGPWSHPSLPRKKWSLWITQVNGLLTDCHCY